MKPDPLTDKVTMFKAATLEARENLAAQLFKPETVSEQMARAAAQGLSFIKVDTKGIDLQQTKAAKELTKRLTAAGAGCEWIVRSLGNDSASLRYADLVIKW
jgi:Holliday junction resolvasome RuvABC ATP-dependent DNA helicase subunit